MVWCKANKRMCSACVFACPHDVYKVVPKVDSDVHWMTIITATVIKWQRHSQRGFDRFASFKPGFPNIASYIRGKPYTFPSIYH